MTERHWSYWSERDAKEAYDELHELRASDSFVKHLGPGQEVECDRAVMTEDAVLVHTKHGWIQLRPPRWK